MALGPVQLLVVGFDRPDFGGEVLAELERLREGDVVRVIDLLVVHKGADGVVQRLHHSDLHAGEAEGVGAVVGALIGLGVCACLMAAFKAFAVWFPTERLPSLNSAVMVAGGLGALAATTPPARTMVARMAVASRPSRRRNRSRSRACKSCRFYSY